MHVVRQMIPNRQDLAAMVRLALPVAVVQVGLMFMGVVDTIMVGHYSTTDLAAVALGNMYFFTAAVFGMGTLFVLDPTVSQAHGAGDEEATSKAIQRGVVLALGLGLMAALLLLPARAVLTLFRQPPEVIPVAAGYALVSIPGVFPFYGFIVLRQSLQAMGLVAPIVWTIVLTNVANAFFNWVLIYGHVGFPEMGAVGTGWATTLSRWLLAAGLLAVAWPILRRYIRPLRPGVLDMGPLVRMVRLGAPIGG
ncbi:MAG: MATE family efflux transporter, partial [Longimicrobiales bacterium]